MNKSTLDRIRGFVELYRLSPERAEADQLIRYDIPEMLAEIVSLQDAVLCATRELHSARLERDAALSQMEKA